MIAYLDQIPAGKELSVRQKVTLNLWGLAVFLIPFMYVPYFVFQKLSLYPLVIIALLNVDKWWNLCWNNKFLRYTAFAVAAFIMWQIISLPFCVGLGDITFSDNIRPVINDGITYAAWYVFLAAAFMFPKNRIEKTFYKSFTAILLCCAAYSILEILHFRGVQWASNILAEAIHYIMTVEPEGWWWPPLFWDQPRLRSVFAEPSYFAIMLVFSVLYYSMQMWINKKRMIFTGNLFLMLLSVLLLCLTKSAGGALSLTAATLVFIILSAIFFRKFPLLLKIKSGILSLLLLISSFLAVACQRGGFAEFATIENALESAEADSAQEQRMLSGSSSTRLIHLKTELKMIGKNPFPGVGSGKYSDAMCEALEASPEQTPELISWWSSRGNTPRLNLYTARMVEFGIPGGILFLNIFIFPGLYLCFSCIRKGCFTVAVSVLAIYTGPIMIMNFANSAIMIYLMLAALPLLTMAAAGEGKPDEFSA